MPNIEGLPDPRLFGALSKDTPIDPDKFKRAMKVDESDEAQKRGKRNLPKKEEEDELEEPTTPAGPNTPFSAYMEGSPSKGSIFAAQEGGGLPVSTSPEADDAATPYPVTAQQYLPSEDGTENNPTSLIFSTPEENTVLPPQIKTANIPGKQKASPSKKKAGAVLPNPLLIKGMIKKAFPTTVPKETTLMKEKREKTAPPPAHRKELKKPAPSLIGGKARKLLPPDAKGEPVKKTAASARPSVPASTIKPKKLLPPAQDNLLSPAGKNQEPLLASPSKALPAKPINLEKLAEKRTPTKTGPLLPTEEEKAKAVAEQLTTFEPEKARTPPLLPLETKEKERIETKKIKPEEQQKEEGKEKEKEEAALLGSSVLPQPTFLPEMIAAAPTPAYALLPSQLFELFERMVGYMTFAQNKGISTTTVTLSMPGSIFDKCQIVLDHYDTAPHSYNMQFLGTASAVDLFSAHLDDLAAAFQQSKLSFKVHIQTPILLENSRPVLRRKGKSGEDGGKESGGGSKKGR